MVFSSSIFLFFFFPAFFAIYYSVPTGWRNWVLFLGSLTFYFYGEGLMSAVLLFYIIFNWFISLLIVSNSGQKRSYLLAFGVLTDVALLLYYKYTVLLWDLLVNTTVSLRLPDPGGAPDVILPIGISFFAFQSISYLLDVHHGRTIPPTSLVDFGTYKAAFPQLIAGPIVRYVDVQDRIVNRPISINDVFEGFIRFSRGLAKKILIADTLARVADLAFTAKSGTLSMEAAWIGLLAYSFQIYFDFSGYSDMAIGMGRMLGFRYPENFDQPYLARNVTEFWRRWHMSLSTWFRDYVYIPLGGNRLGIVRTGVNLLLVFALCGLWHGAAWRFLVWGLWHGLLLSLERVLQRFGIVLSGWAGQIVTFFLVSIGWVFFRANDLTHAQEYLAVLFGRVGSNPQVFDWTLMVGNEATGAFIVAAVVSFVPRTLLKGVNAGTVLTPVIQGVFAVMAVAVSASTISRLGFNPFIYFQF
jgi:alginate O-acetyltransferase complex protein AlgI